MQEKKRFTSQVVREYIETNLQGLPRDKHLSEAEGRWFLAQLLQLEQVEALQRIADALEKMASSYPKL